MPVKACHRNLSGLGFTSNQRRRSKKHTRICNGTVPMREAKSSGLLSVTPKSGQGYLSDGYGKFKDNHRAVDSERSFYSMLKLGNLAYDLIHRTVLTRLSKHS
jgi:hypothetical protein